MARIESTGGRRSPLEKYLVGRSSWDQFAAAQPELADHLHAGREAATLALNALRFRLALGMTIQEVVEASLQLPGGNDFHRSTILAIENGTKRGTRLENLISLSMVLKVRVRDLFEHHDIRRLPADFLVHPSQKPGAGRSEPPPARRKK